MEESLQIELKKSFGKDVIKTLEDFAGFIGNGVEAIAVNSATVTLSLQAVQLRWNLP